MCLKNQSPVTKCFFLFLFLDKGVVSSSSTFQLFLVWFHFIWFQTQKQNKKRMSVWQEKNKFHSVYMCWCTNSQTHTHTFTLIKNGILIQVEKKFVCNHNDVDYIFFCCCFEQMDRLKETMIWWIFDINKNELNEQKKKKSTRPK